MSKKHSVVFLIAVTAILLSARFGSAAEIEAGTLEPRELLERHAQAVMTGDSELFLSTFTTTSPEARALMPSVEAFFDMIVQWVSFHDKFVKAYGVEALETIGMGASAGYKPMSRTEILARPKNTPLTVDGDNGETQSLFTKSEMKLVRLRGRWFINPAGNSKPGSDANPLVRAMVVTTFKRMERSLKNLQLLIGQPGQTPETIKIAMEEAGKEQKQP